MLDITLRQVGVLLARFPDPSVRARIKSGPAADESPGRWIGEAMIAATHSLLPGEDRGSLAELLSRDAGLWDGELDEGVRGDRVIDFCEAIFNRRGFLVFNDHEREMLQTITLLRGCGLPVMAHIPHPWLLASEMTPDAVVEHLAFEVSEALDHVLWGQYPGELCKAADEVAEALDAASQRPCAETITLLARAVASFAAACTAAAGFRGSPGEELLRRFP